MVAIILAKWALTVFNLDLWFPKLSLIGREVVSDLALCISLNANCAFSLEDDLIVSEFELKNKFFTLSSVVGNDLLLEIRGGYEIADYASDKALCAWYVTEVSEDNWRRSFRNSTLFDITNNGEIHPVVEAEDKNDLVCFLFDEQQHEIDITGIWTPKNRVYMSKKWDID